MPIQVIPPGNESLGADAIGGVGQGEGRPGVRGINSDPGGVGVQGFGGGNGVAGISQDGIGVRGDSPNGFAAVHGHGGKNGVWGFTVSANDNGVFGQNDGSGPGVTGFSKDGFGVRGDSTNGFAAVHGHGGKNGVWGFTVSANDSGVFGQNEGSGFGVAGFSHDGIGVRGIGGRLAGSFEGDVEVTGKITTFDVFISGGDCAEDFDISGTEKIEPGTVMVLDPEGALQQSQQAYDRRVAGVISGAGDLRPGIVLDKQQSQGNRMPIALMGKVYCKVDAQYSPVEVGDLLTTSPTAGHAMKAGDPIKAFGSVIGKALRPLLSGQGLVLIMVALQ
ncbi:MAG: hypothetical protein QOF89_1032 [Acidobacteriota bacterium]|nr:hypothetical protein [Acidobacteriota bacterium]